MKLKSGRLYKKDLSDIIGILKEQGELGKPIVLKNIDNAITELYGSWNGIKEGVVNFLSDVLSSDDLGSLYYETLEQEQINKGVLLEFEEKYPDALNESNADSVVAKFLSDDRQNKEKSSLLEKLTRKVDEAKSLNSENKKEVFKDKSRQ